MANGTNSSHRAKDGENNNGRVTPNGEKQKINSHPNVSGTTSLRRSTRETPSKKTISSPSSTWKSGSIEEKSLPTPAARRKPKSVEKKEMPSPLRRSRRTTSHSSSSPSDSKSPGSLSSKQKPKKEKSVKQLTFEAKEVNEDGEHDLGTSQVEIKRMDARMYRSLFKKPKDFLEEPKGIDKSNQEGSKNDGGNIDECSNKTHSDREELCNYDCPVELNRIHKSNQEVDNDAGDIDECSKERPSDCKEVSNNGTLPSEDAKEKELKDGSSLSGPVKGLVKDNMILGSSIPASVTTYVTDVVPEKVQSGCSGEETLRMSVSRNSILDEDLARNNVEHDRGENLVPSKRKRNMVDMDSDVSATLVKDDNCNMIGDPSKLSGNIVGTDGSCSKRVRLDYNPTIHDESSNPSPVEERLSSLNAHRCKSDSFRFVEYWVPVQISQVQVEQYCATLLENASILCSSSKIDSIGSIRDVLISTRKCCNHPYIAHPLGRELVDCLNVEIKASGKVQLLDSMLMELRKNDLRALVLFQTIGGSGRDPIGDILEDFLRLRFGQDSYERVDKGLLQSKKQTAVRKFNEKSNGRFVFLLETCACHPSIKLSSVDAIIIFNSDWNPMNDIRSLQKITLDSQLELIKIFRLYASFTVEEKALIISKQDKTLDISLQNINRSTSHMLLMWGASFLFDELRVFHDGETSESSLNSLFGQPLLEQAIHEFSSILSQDGKDTNTGNNSVLLKVQRNGGTYRADISLFGERKLRLPDEEPPQFFWTKLLEGKQFRWKYPLRSSQRSRKKVHNFDGSVDGPNLASENIAKKRKKVSNNILDQPSSKSEGAKLSTGIKAGTSGGLADRPQGKQRSLHLLLKPEIAKLCEVLLLPDIVKSKVDNFLEYVMHNHHIHHVNMEPVSILQAFQISLCWTAASLLKHKLDHEASLTLAKQHLNFDCKKEEAEYFYSMLRCLKKLYSYHSGNYNDAGSPNASESSNRVYSCTGVAVEVELLRKDMLKSIKKIQKKFAKKLKKLCLVQQEEKQRLIAAMEAEKSDLMRKYKIESAVIRSCSPNFTQRTENLKALSLEYGKRIAELKCQHETRLNNLEDTQSAERLEIQEGEAIWVEEVKTWVQNEINELSNMVASKECGTGVEYMPSCDEVRPNNDPKNHFAEGKDHDNIVITTGTGVPETNSPAVVLQNPLVRHIGASDMVITISEDQSVSRNEGHNIAENGAEIYVVDYCNGANKTVTQKSPLFDGSIADEAISVLDKEAPSGMPGTDSITNCPENVTAVNFPSSLEQISDRSAVDESSDRELSRPCEIACLSTGPDNITVLSSHLEHQKFDGVSSSTPDGSIPVEVRETSNEGDTVSVLGSHLPTETREVVSLTDWLQDATHLDCPSSVDQMSGGSSEAPVFDRVLSTTPCQAASSSNHHVSQETSVCGPVNVTEPLEQLQQLSLVESPPNQDAAGEIQNSSEQAELVSSPADVVQANESNHVPLIMNPSVAVQQLPSAELPSSNPDSSNFPSATEAEYQPINEVDLRSHQPVASMAPNQVVVQPDVIPEHGSRSHQVGVHPSSNSDLDLPIPGGLRNLSTPLGTNSSAMQTATQSASRMPPHLCNDPFINELERIRKVKEETMKNHEDVKLRLKYDFEKELEELRKKYDMKFQEIEVEFQKTKKTLESNFHSVRANKILADAFKSKCLDLKASSPLGMLQDSSLAQQFVQLSRQQNATRTSAVAGPSSHRPPVTNLLSPSTMAQSQQVVPPMQAGYNTPGVFSNASARLSLVNPTSSSSGNLGGSQIRAPAPHLQSYRPPTPVPVPRSVTLPHGLPTPSDVPAMSPRFSIPPRQTRPTTHLPNPPIGRQTDNAGGLPTPNMHSRVNASSQYAINLPTVLSSMSDVASVIPSRFNTSSDMPANTSLQPTTPDLVCLSDDDE